MASSSEPKVGDIEDEDNILRTRARLTKNEYYATIRNKLEHNRLQVIRRHLEDENGLKTCKIRTSIHDIKKEWGEQKNAVCHLAELTQSRKIQSAGPQYRPGGTRIQSSLARLMDQSRPPTRAKSASTMSRPYTAPLHSVRGNFLDHDDTESDDEIIPISFSRATSAKRPSNRPTSSVSTSTVTHPPPSAPLDKTAEEEEPVDAATTVTHCRITWPVRIRVFALQDENEARQQYLAWKAEQRKLKVRRSSKTFFDEELEKKYQESIRRREQLEAYLTPELIDEHKLNDPIFAKRYRQLKLAIRAGKLPNYDPHDCQIHHTMNKAKIERARSALISAKQTKIQTFYRKRQNLNDNELSKRVEVFLNKLEVFKKENL